MSLDGPVGELLAKHDPDGERVVVAAGGDGTLKSVAEEIVGTPRVFGVLPLGTRNHFAKDAGLPLDLAEAIEVLRQGHERPVDTGEVEGRTFLNNASMGLYPRFVEERRRRKRRQARWVAIASAAWWVLRQRRRLRLRVDGETEEVAASVVFVGNNPYGLEGLSLGSRERLDGGTLGLVIATLGGPYGAVRLAVRAVLGRVTEGRDTRSREVKAVEIDTARTRVRVALDGETVRLRAPLHFRIRPGSLTLLAPPPEARDCDAD